VNPLLPANDWSAPIKWAVQRADRLCAVQSAAAIVDHLPEYTHFDQLEQWIPVLGGRCRKISPSPIRLSCACMRRSSVLLPLRATPPASLRQRACDLLSSSIDSNLLAVSATYAVVRDRHGQTELPSDSFPWWS
jgi:hypothetical protein